MNVVAVSFMTPGLWVGRAMDETLRKLSLEELTIIARDVVRAEGQRFEVVGTVASPLDGEYAEIVVVENPPDGGAALRMTIGVIRRQSADRVRVQILEKVRRP